MPMPKQPPTPPAPVALQYLGAGFVVGIPARDLSAEEAAQYDAAALIASGLYAPATLPTPVDEPAAADSMSTPAAA